MTDEEFFTPSEWEKILRVQILDPDGWRTDDAPSWDTPISRDEFNRRMSASTCFIEQDYLGKWAYDE